MATYISQNLKHQILNYFTAAADQPLRNLFPPSQESEWPTAHPQNKEQEKVPARLLIDVTRPSKYWDPKRNTAPIHLNWYTVSEWPTAHPQNKEREKGPRGYWLTWQGPVTTDSRTGIQLLSI